jgi:hypothetical protein
LREEVSLLLHTMFSPLYLVSLGGMETDERGELRSRKGASKLGVRTLCRG